MICLWKIYLHIVSTLMFVHANEDKPKINWFLINNNFQVKCTENALCSTYPITVTITNYCPGACNNEPFHFDLSGKAFGALAKRGQGSNLRQYGRINIQYQRYTIYIYY